MQHSLDQLRRGIIDFCVVLDQAAIGFVWNWVLLPEFSQKVKRDDSVVKTAEAMEIVRNATIESSLISIRILDEFFATTRCRPGDIRSHHYVGYASPGRFLTKQEFDVIGRRIAHLTVDRDKGSQKPWQITELISRCYVPAADFLAFVVEGPGRKYLPEAPFDAASRLRICRKMDWFMQRILQKEALAKKAV